MLDIFEFTSFRTFLQKAYEARKAESYSFSHRYIQQKVGVTSTGWFAGLVKGTLNPTPDQQARLCSVFNLTSEEREYFELMVRYDLIDDLQEKQAVFAKMLGFKKLPMHLLTSEKFEYFRFWYVSAIRELLFLFPFKGNYQSLARKLKPAISVEEATQAIETLQKLGLLKKMASGELRPTENNIRKEPGLGAFFSHSYLDAYMQLGREALGKIPKEERDVSSVTVHLTEDAFRIACKDIEKLRAKLMYLSEKSDKAKRVYQCSIQLIPTAEA